MNKLSRTGGSRTARTKTTITTMYKLYFKQALAMLKENKLLSLISILGTALAICMIMVMVITYEVRVNN